MRFIVKEQSYEKLIASGQFRYELEGEVTGAVENWRLSQAAAGYEVLRVDLDARSAASGHSYLYHLVRQAANGRPERLSFRFWGDGLAIEGTLLFSESSVTGTRSVNGRVHNEDLDIEPETGFWFPSTVGLGLAANLDSGMALTLNNIIGQEDSLELRQINLHVSRMVSDMVEANIANKLIDVSLWQIRWDENIRYVMLAENDWPVHMQRGDGLTAVETRNIWY